MSGEQYEGHLTYSAEHVDALRRKIGEAVEYAKLKRPDLVATAPTLSTLVGENGDLVRRCYVTVHGEEPRMLLTMMEILKIYLQLPCERTKIELIVYDDKD